ncbi:MAG TPA: acetyl-CoA carboxylase biotin carboxyl carrier protein [Solirubrobacteraceae bacterium]|jgi:acetyl-CoA carboxylase biotin carboxyl carrier protein|nr:acetyl-CoA carboxylase biotin carboxyl carrier protein [Solirubrobacteraceae bacterium]
MALTDDDVREILRIIDESDLDELRIETDGFSLHVTKGSAGGGAPSGAAQPSRAAPSGAPQPSRAAPQRAPQPAAASAPPADDGLVTIPSPMLGTFYRAESPGANPLVEVGSRIIPETTVCIIEVMKMMNSVPAGVTGTVAEVIADNAQLVEYGAPLFRVKPE